MSNNFTGPEFPNAFQSPPFVPAGRVNQFPPPPGPPPQFPGGQDRSFPMGGPPNQPPPYPASTAPPSGYRVKLTTTEPFPSPAQAGPPVCFDADGQSPVFIGSAFVNNAVHPCKIAPHLSPPCRIPYGGAEYEHHGRYDLLPFVPGTMEWVRASGGEIPPGRRPVEGGYEDNGAQLYHALGNVNGIQVPGKTGRHLGGCNVAFGGAEIVITHDYFVLCWK